MAKDSSSFNVVAQLAPLRSYARTLTRNRHDSEDLVQETLIRAWEKRHSLQAQGNLRTWLMSILHNTFVSQWRRRQTEQGGAQEQAEWGERMIAPPAQEHTVRLAQIQQAFLRLPDDQRAALHLVSIEGLSYQEAASTLAIPIGTLMSRLGRARAALRAFEDGAAPRARPDTPADRRARLKIVGGSDAG